jgi:2-dehydropantoate 2-reductase
MRLHIVGLGPIGTLVAHHLRISLPREHKITLLHRSKQLAARERRDGGVIRIENNGVVTSSTGYHSEVFDEETHVRCGWKTKQDFLEYKRDMSPGPHTSVTPLPQIESLIVTVKAQLALPIIECLRPRLSANSTIVLLQHGLGVYERLIQRVFRNPETRPQFVLASNTHGAWLKNYSQVVHTYMGHIEFGIISNLGHRDFEASLKDERVPAPDRRLEINDITQSNDPHFRRYRSLKLTVAALSAAEALCSKWRPIHEVQMTMRRNLVVHAVIDPLTALMGCRNGDIFTERSSKHIAKGICMEASAAYARELESSAHHMLKRFGDVDNRGQIPIGCLPLPLRPRALELECSRVANITRGRFSPMLIDVRKGHKTEIEYINGYLLRLGAAHGLSMPNNLMLLNLINMRSSIPLDQIP